MSLLTRWAARTAEGQPAKTAKTAKRRDAFGRAEAQQFATFAVFAIEPRQLSPGPRPAVPRLRRRLVRARARR